jgi:hypothetical protein
MKLFLLCLSLFAAHFAFGQATNPQPLPTTFIIKGQEWEYTNFEPKMGFLGKRKGFYEITRFVYKVTGVTDSSGVMVSTITKTGTAANADYNWRRNFTVRTNGTDLFLPVDYYLMDTFYLCDAYGKWPKPSVFSALHVTGDSLQYPIKMDSTGPLKLSDCYMVQDVYDPQRADGMANVGFKGQSRSYRNKANATETTRKIVGTARITTGAGTFDCYHIHVEVDIDLKSIRKTTYEEYYNPEVGIVRTEDIHGPYMELVRVKKKK